MKTIEPWCNEAVKFIETLRNEIFNKIEPISKTDFKAKNLNSKSECSVHSYALVHFYAWKRFLIFFPKYK